MLKNHRRNIKRLSEKFCISIDEAIEKFYGQQKIDKNVIFSIKKKRNKGRKSKKNHSKNKDLKNKID